MEGSKLPAHWWYAPEVVSGDASRVEAQAACRGTRGLPLTALSGSGLGGGQQAARSLVVRTRGGVR